MSFLSYTNQITSTTDAGLCHTRTLPEWKREPNLAKLAHVCELHFEWGLVDTIIKSFRTVFWPSIILRALCAGGRHELEGCRSFYEFTYQKAGTASGRSGYANEGACATSLVYGPSVCDYINVCFLFIDVVSLARGAGVAWSRSCPS